MDFVCQIRPTSRDLRVDKKGDPEQIPYLLSHCVEAAFYMCNSFGRAEPDGSHLDSIITFSGHFGAFFVGTQPAS